MEDACKRIPRKRLVEATGVDRGVVPIAVAQVPQRRQVYRKRVEEVAVALVGDGTHLGETLGIVGVLRHERAFSVLRLHLACLCRIVLFRLVQLRCLLFEEFGVIFLDVRLTLAQTFHLGAKRILPSLSKIGKRLEYLQSHAVAAPPPVGERVEIGEGSARLGPDVARAHRRPFVIIGNHPLRC